MTSSEDLIATYDDAIMDLWDLNPAFYNPRRDLQPGDPQYESIMKSILEFGYKDPMVWNKRTGRLVGGHQRLKILKQLGFSKAKVVVVNVDENTEIQLNIALNNATGENDEVKLAALLTRLKDNGCDIKACGFDDRSLHEMLDVTEDEAQEPTECMVRPGEIWVLGNHRLMCGDAINHEDVCRLMAGQKTRMICTDPPYNCDYGSSIAPDKQSKSRKVIYGDNNAAIRNDSMGTDAWRDFCLKLYAIYKEFCDGDIYQFGASGPEGMRSRLWLVEEGCHWSATIIWLKDALVISPANFNRMYEPIFYGWFKRSSFNSRMNNGGDRTETEVWSIPRPLKSEMHPTMKPVELMARAVQNSSLPGDVVLDLFGGSGSTLIACEQTGRRCCMMEFEPAYCDVIIHRWEAATEKKAVRVDV